jgi:hypothetical protein
MDGAQKVEIPFQKQVYCLVNSLKVFHKLKNFVKLCYYLLHFTFLNMFYKSFTFYVNFSVKRPCIIYRSYLVLLLLSRKPDKLCFAVLLKQILTFWSKIFSCWKWNHDLDNFLSQLSYFQFKYLFITSTVIPSINLSKEITSTVLSY